MLLLLWLGLVSGSLVPFLANSSSPNGRFVIEQLQNDVLIHDLWFKGNSVRYPGPGSLIRYLAWEPASMFFLALTSDRYATLYMTDSSASRQPYAQFLHSAPVMDAYCYEHEFYTLTADGLGYRWFVNRTIAPKETEIDVNSDDLQHSKVQEHQFSPETETLEVFFSDGTLCRQNFQSGTRQCYIPQPKSGENFGKKLGNVITPPTQAETASPASNYENRFPRSSFDNFAVGFSVGVGAIIAVLFDLFGDVKHVLIPRTTYVVTLILTVLKHETLFAHPLLAFITGIVLTNPAILRSLAG